MGMTLRQAWCINGTLYNSEVWCAFSKADIEVLEVLDRKILRVILGAHCKVPSEMLYLETGAISISNVISVRRLLYLQTILKKTDNEIVKKVYIAQKVSPCNGDWIKLIDSDKEYYNIPLSDEAITEMTEEKYKSFVKSQVKERAFEDLKKIQNEHSKVNNILFEILNKP